MSDSEQGSKRLTPRLIWISGPPASGKSALAARLVRVFERGIVIPVDDIREWVKSGAAGPSPWTEETERQYRLGEESACDVARRYYASGFGVIIDACRSPSRIDELLAAGLDGMEVVKVLLLPDLEENFRRAHTRTNKDFDLHFLDEIIRHTHNRYRGELHSGWLGLDNSRLTLEEEVDWLLERIPVKSTGTVS